MPDDLRPRALGVDYGEARFGLAISDELGMLAHPLPTLDCRRLDPAKEIARLVQEKVIRTIVLGLPRNMDGTEGASATGARTFAADLEKILSSQTSDAPVKIVFVDERLSTVEASRALRSAGHNAKAQKNRIDQGAARIILQTWLDQQACLS